MFCPSCGAKNAAGIRVCVECARALPGVRSPSSSEPTQQSAPAGLPSITQPNKPVMLQPDPVTNVDHPLINTVPDALATATATATATAAAAPALVSFNENSGAGPGPGPVQAPAEPPRILKRPHPLAAPVPLDALPRSATPFPQPPTSAASAAQNALAQAAAAAAGPTLGPAPVTAVTPSAPSAASPAAAAPRPVTAIHQSPLGKLPPMTPAAPAERAPAPVSGTFGAPAAPPAAQAQSRAEAAVAAAVAGAALPSRNGKVAAEDPTMVRKDPQPVPRPAAVPAAPTALVEKANGRAAGPPEHTPEPRSVVQGARPISGSGRAIIEKGPAQPLPPIPPPVPRTDETTERVARTRSGAAVSQTQEEPAPPPAPAPAPAAASTSAGASARDRSAPTSVTVAPGMRWLAAGLVDLVLGGALAGAAVAGALTQRGVRVAWQPVVDFIHANPPVALGLLFGAPAAAWALYQLLGVVVLGATFGQRLCGLRVVRAADGKKPGIIRAFVRAVFATLGLLLLGIGPLWAFWMDRRRRGLGDAVAGTVLVRNPAARAKP